MIPISQRRSWWTTLGSTALWVMTLQFAATAQVSLLSAASGGSANNNSIAPAVSADGAWFVFESAASNLVPGDTNGYRDVFAVDRASNAISKASQGVLELQSNNSSQSPSSTADGRYVAFSSTASNLAIGDTNGVADIFVHDRQTGLVARISVGEGGTQGNSGSFDPAISADGRYISFRSNASNLVDGDTNSRDDIFVYDRQLGVMSLASVGTNSTQSNSESYDPSISADGRYVAFWSVASNLVIDDTNGRDDVFVRDLQSGETIRASVGAGGAEANSWSDTPSMSSDGRYVAFRSNASNLVSNDTNATWDVFVHDRETGVTTRASVGTGGSQASSSSSSPSITADGRYVAFMSIASNLVSDDTNSTWDIFVHDRQTDVTMRVSVGSNGLQANSSSYDPSISESGQYVLFASSANNLVVGDSNAQDDVFAYDLLANATTRASVRADGLQANGASDTPSISDDGRYVVYRSGASNLVSDDTNAASDIFMRDRQTGATTRVSMGILAAQANGSSEQPDISGSGGFVVFHSDASNLVLGDSNGLVDIFVRDISAGTTSRVSVAASGSQAADGDSLDASISADGRYIAFMSLASNLVIGDSNARSDIFVRDRMTSTTVRVSVGTAGGQANGHSREPAISDDGRFVVFTSAASNLVPGDTNNAEDVFIHERQTGTTTRVSLGASGAQPSGSSSSPDVSSDGRYVVFQSSAADLVASDTNGLDDVFLRDRQSGVTSRVSVAQPNAVQLSGASRTPSISGDGQFIAFESAASTLVQGDTNGFIDVFVVGLSPASIVRASATSLGGQANLASTRPAISGNGRYVAFESDASNLVTGDVNATRDVFAFDRLWAPTCPGDADGNGSVSFLDITTVLASFGTDYGPPPATGSGDADRNGAVNFLDITTVLANFGSACQ